MREHQIVITLKPDQFLEVQRLARAANSKSMGVFVRQRLLAALGIEGAAAADPNASNVDVEAILGDLKRVHSELKSFVAESLSPYSPDAFGQTEFAETDLQQLNLFADDEAVSNAVASIEAAHDDELERVAERAFAISPRLGTIGHAHRIAKTIDDGKTHELLSRHEIHSRRDMHRYHHPHASSDTMDVPFVQETPAEPGSMPTPAQPTNVDDPLAKLLTGDELNRKTVKPRVEADYDDDTFDVPLSIAERRRQMAAEHHDPEPIQLNEVQPAQVDYDFPTNIDHDLSTQVAIQPAQAVQSSISVQPNGVSDDAIDENGVETDSTYSQASEDGSTTSSSSGMEPQNELGRPLGYPPLSGSPPPKRRQYESR